MTPQDFIKAVIRDVIIYTIPFILARTCLYPIVNINSRLQRSHRKIEEEADVKERYQKYQNFKISEKIQCAQDIISISGYTGIYEKFDNFIVPFIFGRVSEGIVYFTLMRLCLDVYKLEDPLYLLTGLVLFFASLTAAFFLKLMGDVMRERKGLKAALSLVSPSNANFWKQYEIELGCYHSFTLIQGYIQLSTYWYLKPTFSMELVLFFISRYVAVICCQPLAILVNWASENDFDYGKVFEKVTKRDGFTGLFAGVRDLLLNEIIFSVVLISGCHTVASLI